MSLDGFTVLQVEDEPDDVVLLEEAFARCELVGVLRSVRDGEEALEYLQGHGGYADRRLCRLPSVILLDLKLPKRSGLEVLHWLRRQPGLKRIPVIVLTSSMESCDINSAYDLGANSYLVKPVDSTQLLAIVDGVRAYWASLNQGPASLSAD